MKEKPSTYIYIFLSIILGISIFNELRSPSIRIDREALRNTEELSFDSKKAKGRSFSDIKKDMVMKKAEPLIKKDLGSSGNYAIKEFASRDTSSSSYENLFTTYTCIVYKLNAELDTVFYEYEIATALEINSSRNSPARLDIKIIEVRRVR